MVNASHTFGGSDVLVIRLQFLPVVAEQTLPGGFEAFLSLVFNLLYNVFFSIVLMIIRVYE